jgi:hypothetical protein
VYQSAGIVILAEWTVPPFQSFNLIFFALNKYLCEYMLYMKVKKRKQYLDEEFGFLDYLFIHWTYPVFNAQATYQMLFAASQEYSMRYCS